MVPLDEQRGPRRGSVLGHPTREVTCPIVAPCRFVDSLRVGPDSKVTYVENPREAHAEVRLEGEHVIVETIKCSVNVSCGTDDHATSLPSPTRGINGAIARAAFGWMSWACLLGERESRCEAGHLPGS